MNVEIGGVKADDGKARFDLIPAGPLRELADVYTMGAKKYADRNWEKGIKYGRVYAAIMRHLWAYWQGQDRDSESGKSHLAHAAFGCFALMEFSKTHPECDDRPGIARPLAQNANQVSMDWAPAEPHGLPGKVFVLPDQDQQIAPNLATRPGPQCCGIGHSLPTSCRLT